jgi:hypothetical protein
LDDVEADLRTMGIKRWRLIAKDRTEWASIVREARAVKPERRRRILPSHLLLTFPNDTFLSGVPLQNSVCIFLPSKPWYHSSSRIIRTV